ncbi:hypothetical protein [Nonomuraea sp. GTA35]|uniref:hypothetical protein n=1 Tax=Nonomuraea sp. GTA35 TaxID=1676746 RepID=UPI0035C0F165
MRTHMRFEASGPPSPASAVALPRQLPAAPATVVASPQPRESVTVVARQQPPESATVVPRPSPAVPGHLFSGREAELRLLDEALSQEGAARAVAIVGAGGVGKTWLALHWADRNAGLFPDGQLHVNLRGSDPVTPPVPPEEAVRGFLLALGADPRAVPAEPEAQAELYRSMMAGRRMLVLIEDAASPAQVETLLPGTTSSAVLVTSRRHPGRPLSGHGAQELPFTGPDAQVSSLGGLGVQELFPGGPGVRVLPLEGLSEQEASRLLVRSAGTTQPHAVRDLIRHCAGLPLALGIVAARVAARPHLPLDTLTAELRNAVTHPETLDAGEIPGGLRAVLHASCLSLAEDARRLFLALGPAPVPDVGLPAAASLAALPAARTRTLMRLLEAAHLVVQYRPGRYRMHDLIRLYAIEQGRPAASAAALRRLVDHYLHTANRGEHTLAPQIRPITMNPPAQGVDLTPLTTEQDALEWFDAERDCLLALLRWTADQDWNENTWRIAWSMDEMLQRRGHVHDRVHVWEAAVFAAERLGAAEVQCLAYRRLGHAHLQAGDHAAALPALRRALALAGHLRRLRGNRPAERRTVRRHLIG